MSNAPFLAATTRPTAATQHKARFHHFLDVMQRSVAIAQG